VGGKVDGKIGVEDGGFGGVRSGKKEQMGRGEWWDEELIRRGERVRLKDGLERR
jgi:hypothetical protein